MGIKILAGDFKNSSENGARASFTLGQFMLPDPDAGFAWLPKYVNYDMSRIRQLDELSEDNKVSVLGAAGWGTIGALALGPVGLLGGLVLAGRGKAVVFAVTFDDGKRALIEADQRTWKKILTSRF